MAAALRNRGNEGIIMALDQYFERGFFIRDCAKHPQDQFGNMYWRFIISMVSAILHRRKQDTIIMGLSLFQTLCYLGIMFIYASWFYC